MIHGSSHAEAGTERQIRMRHATTCCTYLQNAHHGICGQTDSLCSRLSISRGHFQAKSLQQGIEAGHCLLGSMREVCWQV